MMHDCVAGDIRDQLPEFVHGALLAAEHARVQAHVDSCADCAAEVGLIWEAAALFVAPAVNIDAIVAALPARRPRVRNWGWAAAAGLVLIGGLALANWRLPKQAEPPSTSASAVDVGPSEPVAKLASAADETTSAARRPPAAASAKPSVSFGGGLSDLTDDQLKALLNEIDEIDAAPSADPAVRLPAVDESTARARRGGGPDGK